MPLRHMNRTLKFAPASKARALASISPKLKTVKREPSPGGMRARKTWALPALVFAALLRLMVPQAAHAQATTSTVTTGTNPNAMAVNPVTDKIYVANLGNGQFCENTSFVTVIDGATNATWSVPAGYCPGAIAVNPVTNRIYAVNTSDFDLCCSNVTVIDGEMQGALTNITVGGGAYAVAVNPVTNRIYITNNEDDTVSVIDGATNTVVDTIKVGSGPGPIALNPVTNKIYVVDLGRITNNGGLTVIDGSTGQIVNVGTGPSPSGVAVNPVTNTIYVAYMGTADEAGGITLVDGATESKLKRFAGSGRAEFHCGQSGDQPGVCG